jgi:hypothetical protein
LVVSLEYKAYHLPARSKAQREPLIAVRAMARAIRNATCPTT